MLVLGCGSPEPAGAKPRPRAQAAGDRVKAMVAERKEQDRTIEPGNSRPSSPPANVPGATDRPAPEIPANVDLPVDPEPAPPPVPSEIVADAEPAPEPAMDTGTSGADPAVPDPPEPDPAVPTGDEASDSAAPVAPSSAGAQIAEGVEFLEMVLASDVVDHKPVGVGTSFPAGTRVSLFMHVRNESGAEQSLRVAWRTESTGKRSASTRVRLVKSRKGHKTRAFRTMRRAGSYTAVVMKADEDVEIAALAFTITEPEE